MSSPEATTLLMKSWRQAYFQSPNKINAIKFDDLNWSRLRDFIYEFDQKWVLNV